MYSSMYSSTHDIWIQLIFGYPGTRSVPVPARFRLIMLYRFVSGTLLDSEALSTESLQGSVGKFGKVITWELKQKILGLPKDAWSPIVISGECRVFRLGRPMIFTGRFLWV